MSKKSMNERLSEVHTDMKYSELGDVTSWKFYVVEVVFQFFLFVLASIIMTCSFPTLEDRMPAVPLEPQLQPVEESQECRDCCRLGGVCGVCKSNGFVTPDQPTAALKSPAPLEEDQEPDMNVLTKALDTHGPEQKAMAAAEEDLARVPCRGSLSKKARRAALWRKFGKKTSSKLLSKQSFENAVKSLLPEGKKIGAQGLSCLQLAVEAGMAQLFHEANMCSQHCGRSTVWPKDFHLVQQIKPDDVVLRGWVPCGPLKPPRVSATMVAEGGRLLLSKQSALQNADNSKVAT